MRVHCAQKLRSHGNATERMCYSRVVVEVGACADLRVVNTGSNVVALAAHICYLRTCAHCTIANLRVQFDELH